MMQPSATTSSQSRRRGAAYVLVLTTGMLLAVIGMGILASSRSTNRTISHTTELAEATQLAESGVEWGLAAIKNDAAWRTTYRNDTFTAPVAMGRGHVTFKIVDDVDADLANNASDAIRVVGRGTVGDASRMYGVSLTGTGDVLDSLRNAAQAGGNLSVTSSITTAGGAISANGTLAVPSGITVTGDVEATTLNISGSVTGSRTSLGSSRKLPQSTVFDTYKSQAMTIPFASISGGNINNRVISGASNPWGTANASGVYYIKVPSTGTLTIKSSRLVATLIVEVDPGGVFTMSGAVAWNPPRTDFPTLIIKAGSTSSVSLAGTTGTLSEATTLTNFNPAGTPNSSGVSDTDYSDTYTSEFRGVLHVVGTGFTTNLTNNFKLTGAVLTEGNMSLGLGVRLTADPTLASSPPVGYTSVSDMRVTAGSWRWLTQ